MATIFPGNRMKMTGVIGRDASITFDGLEGGTVEYVVTGPKNILYDSMQVYRLLQTILHGSEEF